MNKFNLGKVRGEDGKSATIAIGTVRTGRAGSDASVDNVGDSLRAIFDFTIPRGDKGEKGDRGNEAYTAGSNVQISGGVISATDTTYAPATPSADGLMTSADKVKLNGIASGATKNATDAQLRDRATHTGTQAISTVSGLQGELDTKANTSTHVIAGTGLSGGGNLSVNRTLSVNYGTTAGTAAQGNDSRLSNSREWTAATVSQAEAEAGTGTTRGAWTAQRVRQAIAAWYLTVSTGFTRTLLGRSTAAQIRGDLELGTAATRDVTASGTDTTEGRLLKVGDYGLGGEVIHPLDWDTENMVSGIYSSDGGLQSGNVPYANPWGSTLVMRYRREISPHLSPKLHIRYSSVEPQVYVQSRVIAPWREILHTGNILYTTGQSTAYPMTQKAVTDAINAAASATPVVVSTNATVTLTNNQAVYAVNTAGAARTLTLPASPAAGARVTIIDYANTFQTNACTVARNGKNIEGAASDLSLHLRGQSITLLFVDNTVGWKIIAQSKQGGFA